MNEFDLVLPTAVDVREVGMRDGLQLEDPLPLYDKLALLEALVATGVRRIEVTSFVSPRAVPALADADQLAAELHGFEGVHFSALVANPRGAVRAVDAGIAHLEYVVSASDSHSRANAGRPTAEAVAAVGEIAALAHGAGGSLEVIVATAWDCPFAPGASGNIATEELVYWLADAEVHTGIDLDAVLAAAAVTERAVGHELPSSLYRAGGRSVPRGAVVPA